MARVIGPRSSVVALVAAVALLSSCSGGSTPASTTSSGASASQGVPSASNSGTTAAAGRCANAYQPVAEGDAWTYGTSGTGGAGGYTDTITAVSDARFTVRSDFGKLTKDTEWSCGAEGLVALEYGGGASGSLTSSGLSASFQTKKVTGVTIPTSIDPGDRWTQSYTLKGALEVAGTRATATGSVSQDFVAGKTVSVTVPAGTFDAIAVDTTTHLDLATSVGGVQAPVSTTFSGTTYLVQGVGMVKSTSEASLLGQRIESTIALASYTVS